MTNKEKLIKWGKQKFESDKRGKIILLINTISMLSNYVRDAEECFTHKTFLTFEKFETFIKENYDNELIEKILNTKFYDKLEEYKEAEEHFKKYGISMKDMRIIDFCWKSSEDRKALILW